MHPTFLFNVFLNASIIFFVFSMIFLFADIYISCSSSVIFLFIS